MCFMTKCPYVPPHAFNLDFPHLMLRARAVEAKNGKTGFHPAPAGGNGPQRHSWRASPRRWSTGRPTRRNTLTRPADGEAAPASTATPTLPKFTAKTFVARRPRRSDFAQPRRARFRQAQGGALCHLLRQLQQARDRHGGARGAQSYRRGNHGRLSRLLRHAVPGTGRSGARRRRTPRRSRRNW